VLLNWFKIKNNLFHMSDRNQLFLFLLSVNFIIRFVIAKIFSGGFGIGTDTLSERGLIAWDISLCVWIWSWSLLYLLNKSNNRISVLLVPSKPRERRRAFGPNYLLILLEASHTLHDKYQWPNFYLANALYNRNKSRNISYCAG